MVYGKILLKNILHDYDTENYSYINSFNNLSIFNEKNNSFSSFIDSKIAHCETISKEINRIKFLKNMFKSITKKAISNEEKIIKCLIFSQKHFYHHFGYFAHKPNENIIQDPIANLIFRACRCGNIARFLVDILIINGYKARLITSKSHTFSEVFLKGNWRLLDANIFPPGVFPKGSDNSLLTINELCENPEILDNFPSFINYHSEHAELYKKYFPNKSKDNLRWFREPLHPSSAYFGEISSICNKNNAYNDNNLIRRFEKRYEPSYWNKDDNFGWDNLKELKPKSAKSVNFSQRPQEVISITKDENYIKWDKYKFRNKDIIFSINVSFSSRGWDYKNIKNNFNFKTFSEFTFNTKKPFLKINKDLKDKRLFITITSKHLKDSHKFALPSREFKLNTN